MNAKPINKPELRNPIEYYEAMVGRGPWCYYYPQYNIRVHNEARQQAWEQEQARTEIRNLKFGIS